MNDKMLSGLLVFILMLMTGCGKGGGEFNVNIEDILVKASVDYSSGKNEEARKNYLKAAELGSAEASYQLVRKSLVKDNDRLQYLRRAAMAGHSEALRSFLDETVLMAAHTQPIEALNVLRVAKINNADLDIIYLNRLENVLIIAADFINYEPINKKNSCLAENGCLYSQWELAEKYSAESIENYDSKLILSLVVSSGGVPYEYMSAVEWAYDNHVNNRKGVFNLCNHATSGLTAAYCSKRISEAKKNTLVNVLKDKLIRQVGHNYVDVLMSLDLANNYFMAHAWNEVVTHTGSIRNAEASNYASMLFESEVKFLMSVLDGWMPENSIGSAMDGKELEYYYNSALAVTYEFKKKHNNVDYDGLIPPRIFPEDVRETQEVWRIYKNEMSKTLGIINPRLSENEWTSYLTRKRIQFLKSVTPDLEY